MKIGRGSGGNDKIPVNSSNPVNTAIAVIVKIPIIIDPEIINDKEAKLVNSITLSYTFYKIDEGLETVSTFTNKNNNIN